MFASHSTGWWSPRKEILHNIDPLWPPPESNPLWASPEPDDVTKYGQKKLFDIDTRAAIRVGDWKLITGDPSGGDPSKYELLKFHPIVYFFLQKMI